MTERGSQWDLRHSLKITTHSGDLKLNSDVLKLCKVCARWIPLVLPQLLTDDGKREPVGIVSLLANQDLLRRFNKLKNHLFFCLVMHKSL